MLKMMSPRYAEKSLRCSAVMLVYASSQSLKTSARCWITFCRAMNASRVTVINPMSCMITWCAGCSRACCTKTMPTTSTLPNGAKQIGQLRCNLHSKRRVNAFASWGVASTATIRVIATTPPNEPGLQVADYFLWALQRLYERGEDRYVAYLWPQFHLVQDVDDTRQTRYGVYYTQKKPLTAAALADRS